MQTHPKGTPIYGVRHNIYIYIWIDIYQLYLIYVKFSQCEILLNTIFIVQVKFRHFHTKGLFFWFCFYFFRKRFCFYFTKNVFKIWIKNENMKMSFLIFLKRKRIEYFKPTLGIHSSCCSPSVTCHQRCQPGRVGPARPDFCGLKAWPGPDIKARSGLDIPFGVHGPARSLAQTSARLASPKARLILA